MIFLTIALPIIFVFCNGKVIHEPIVQTSYGPVKGKLEFSRSGKEFFSFKGIPYAKPPVNELRFKPPEEPPKWETVFNAQDDAPHCLQKNYLFKNPTVEGSEDCLYLNVYTPKLVEPRSADNIVHTDIKLLPVMVFIHWGGFFAGYSSADYLGPDYIMDKDVVLVTFNYRLGVLGFFSTNDDASPGNYGLKDQLAVLKWVEKNIQYFSGNNKTVTLFGQSAGAASVNFHMYNEESRKLFHRGISESGSSLSLWAQPQGATQMMIATATGNFVNCTYTGNTTVLVECLRKVNATFLVDIGDKFKIFSVDPLNVYMPSIEQKTDNNPKPFLTKDPAQYIRDKDFANIPWIIGVVSSEGLIRAEALIRQNSIRLMLNDKFEALMPNLLALFMSAPPEQLGNLWNKVNQYYFLGKSSLDDNNPSVLKGLINVYTDRSFVYSTYQATMFHHLQGHKDIWFYEFDYRGQYSYGDVFAATDEDGPIPGFKWGVSHCDELLYLFKTPTLFNGLKHHNDIIMIEKMVQLWTNFAIYGDPTPESTRDKLVEWLKIDDSSISTDPKKLHYLSFTGNNKNDFPPVIEMKYGFHSNRLKFWEEIPLFENIPELNETRAVIPK